MATGYSGTPLARKLSLKDGMRVWWDAVPDSVLEEIATEGPQFDYSTLPSRPSTLPTSSSLSGSTSRRS
jgi:hypothetical protein